MIQSPRLEGGKGIPAPGLLILTGPSHAGKSTVAEEILSAVPPPAAYLCVDEVLERVLRRPAGDPWDQIPLAYELIAGDLGVLLGKGWFVVAESTFTYIPQSGDAQLHEEVLTKWIEIADSLDAPCLVAQLVAPSETILSRAERTGRLDSAIVSETIRLHDAADLGSSTQVIDTGDRNPSAATQELLDRLGGSAVNR